MPRGLATASNPQPPAPRSYAQDLGWTSDSTAEGLSWTGSYRACSLRWQGYIHQPRGGGRLCFYILRPPFDVLKDTHFGACFHARNDGWWLVSFDLSAPPNLDSGI